MNPKHCWIRLEVLTISFACVIDSAEVLVAAALVGTLSVVADVGTHSELLALVLICETPQKPHDTQRKYKAP